MFPLVLILCYEWRGEFSISLFLLHNHGPLFPLQIITNQNTVFSPTILLNHRTYTLQYYQIIHSIYKIIPSISFTWNNLYFYHIKYVDRYSNLICFTWPLYEYSVKKSGSLNDIIWKIIHHLPWGFFFSNPHKSIKFLSLSIQYGQCNIKTLHWSGIVCMSLTYHQQLASKKQTSETTGHHI